MSTTILNGQKSEFEIGNNRNGISYQHAHLYIVSNQPSQFQKSMCMYSGLNGVVVTVLFSILKWPKLKVKKKTDKIPSKNNVIGTEGLETRCFFSLKNY